MRVSSIVVPSIDVSGLKRRTGGCPDCDGRGIRHNEEIVRSTGTKQYIICECRGGSGAGKRDPKQQRGLPWIDRMGFLSDSPERLAPDTINSKAFQEGYDTVFTKGG